MRFFDEIPCRRAVNIPTLWQRRGILWLVMLAALTAFPAASFAKTPEGADLSVVKASIIDFNVSELKSSLSDGSYRGEAGMLRLKPEVAQSLGLNVLINKDYQEAKRLRKQSEELLEKVLKALVTSSEEAFPGEHAKRAGDLAVAYNETTRAARRRIMAYASQLKPGVDERLDEDLCRVLMDELLENSFKEMDYNLRDGLGDFYNRCQSLKRKNWPLTSANVRFVNYVFTEFTAKAPDQAKRFDMDQMRTEGTDNLVDGWKRALGGKAAQYMTLLQAVLKGMGGESGVDPLLFLALMRQESSFNPRSISSVGAAGLTQIMPQTGKGLGMENIFMPAYFEQARHHLVKERSLSRRAMALVAEITPRTKGELSLRARRLMQQSMIEGEKARALYARYREELLEEAQDDRLDPQRSIKYGYVYFSKMMRAQSGDMSLALAAYNSGPHRVKQYSGIPPYDETVSFRNRVLRFYRRYLSRVERYRVRSRPATEQVLPDGNLEGAVPVGRALFQ